MRGGWNIEATCQTFRHYQLRSPVTMYHPDRLGFACEALALRPTQLAVRGDNRQTFDREEFVPDDGLHQAALGRTLIVVDSEPDLY